MPAARRSRIEISANIKPHRPRERLFARSGGRTPPARAAANTVEIPIYDEIGAFGVSAGQFRSQLKAAAGKNLIVRINSPGGDAFDGIAIHNDLVDYSGNVRVEIVGLAASAASVIAMAGNSIAIAPNAFLMIHRTWGYTIGNTNDHADQAVLLGELDQVLAETYSARSGLPVDQAMTMMDDETWLNGNDALDLGLATELLPAASAGQAQARFDLSPYRQAPSGLSHVRPAGEINSRGDLERILLQSGVRNAAAGIIAESGFRALAGEPDRQSQEWRQLMARIDAAAAELRSSK
jgi:ATP-dependent Clp protease protease subunit